MKRDMINEALNYMPESEQLDEFDIPSSVGIGLYGLGAIGTLLASIKMGQSDWGQSTAITDTLKKGTSGITGIFTGIKEWINVAREKGLKKKDNAAIQEFLSENKFDVVRAQKVYTKIKKEQEHLKSGKWKTQKTIDKRTGEVDELKGLAGQSADKFKIQLAHSKLSDRQKDAIMTYLGKKKGIAISRDEE